MYYLQSRYYNPEWGRFINADNIVGETGELLTHNLFSYCENNPISREDPDGHWWVIGSLVGVAGQYAADIIDNSIQDGGFSLKSLRRRSTWGDYASAAFCGALGGGLVKNIIKVVGGAAVKSGFDYATKGKKGSGKFLENVRDNAIGSGLGGVVGKVAQPLSKLQYYSKNYYKLKNKSTSSRVLRGKWGKYCYKYELIRDNMVGAAWAAKTSW